MWFVLYALVAIAVFVGLIWRFKLKVNLHITPELTDIILEIAFFFALIKIRTRLRLYYMNGSKIIFVKINKDNSRQVITKKSKKKRAIHKLLLMNMPIMDYKSWLKVEKLDIYAKIGVGEAYSTVLLCGLLKTMLEMVIGAMFYDDKPNVYCEVLPDFEKETVILNLEGIMLLHHVKIIFATLKDIVKIKSDASKGVKP